MEHRYSDRVVTDLKVLIYKSGMPVAIGRVKNGSKLGFFVETDFAAINVLQSLDVEILLYRNPHKILRHKYTTRVIRKAATGLGLELESVSAELDRVLGDLLRSPQARQQSFKVMQGAMSPTVAQPSKKMVQVG